MGLIQFGQKQAKYPKVAWGNPLTRGLRNALLFDNTVFDAAQQKVVPVTPAYGTPTWIATPGGKALYTPYNAAAIVAVNEDWSGPSTTIWRGRLDAIKSPWGAWWAKAGTGNATQISIGRFNTSDNFYLGRQATVQQLTGSSISGSSGGLVTLAYVVQSASTDGYVFLYRNGTLVQDVVSAYLQTTGVGSLYLGCESTVASSTYEADAYWNSFFRFNRALSASEIAAIGNDPESVLLERRRIWVPVGASGGTTYTFSASGSVALSGAAPLTRGRVFLPSGVVAFSGTSPFTATGVANYTFTTSGSFALSGASPASRGRVLLSSGVVAFSGSSPFSSGASTSYTFNTGGSFSLSGVSLMARGRVFLPSGSITFSGTALWQKGWVYPASGQVQFSGTANMYFTSGLASGLVDRMLKGMGK